MATRRGTLQGRAKGVCGALAVTLVAASLTFASTPAGAADEGDKPEWSELDGAQQGQKSGEQSGEKSGQETSRDAKPKKKKKFKVKQEVVFNHPFVKGREAAIHRKIISTVKHVKKGEKIRVMTWNFDSPALHWAMINAHRRGATVQILMSRGLSKTQGPGRSYPTLKRELAVKNKQRKKKRRSWIRTCSSTCRGRGGAMHSKLMLVSKAGKSKHIVMQGSANFTGAAAFNQFNDWTTDVGRKSQYKGWMAMFRQAKKDRDYSPLRFKNGDVVSMFAPHRSKKDPALKALSTVRCRGANNTNTRGRTKVRVANAVWGDARGVRIARRVKQLHNQGCDVRVVVMMLPKKIRDILAGVPAKQMVYVTGETANKFKDKYVHLKALAVRGNVLGRNDGNLVLSSSENWTQLGWISDEQNVMYRNRAGRTGNYIKWIDQIFREAPRTLADYTGAADPNGRGTGDLGFLSPEDYDFHELEAELH